MKNSALSFTAPILRIIPILLAACGVLLPALPAYAAQHTATAVSFAFSAPPEVPDALGNPYCGWYQIFGYQLGDDRDAIINRSLGWNLDLNRLAQIQIKLSAYRDADISETGLAQIERIFSVWEEETNAHLIVRFLYDWSGRAARSEPDSIEQIKRHMEQIAPIVNAHKDRIYLLQGVWVGNNGEMHDSAYIADAPYIELMTTLCSLIDPSIYLSVRTPQYYRLFTNRLTPISREEFFPGAPASRIGLYNDGMLASETDLGTYGGVDLTQTAKPSVRGLRAQEIAFQSQLCLYVPNGGEIVYDTAYNDPENAVADLSAMHVSYLNSGYDPAPLKKWKNSVWQSGGIFDGISAYDYIERHLGYRYVLRDASCVYPGAFSPEPSEPGGPAAGAASPALLSELFPRMSSPLAFLSISVENTGFANCYRPLACEVTAVRKLDGARLPLRPDTDSRFWNSGEVTEIPVLLDLRELPPGTYRIELTLTDPSSGERIAFANDFGSDDPYVCTIGTLSRNAASSFTNQIRFPSFLRASSSDNT